jgi:hypothetical protein
MGGLSAGIVIESAMYSGVAGSRRTDVMVDHRPGSANVSPEVVGVEKQRL